MNPVAFNCVFLYVAVVFLSLIQSRFRIYKDDPYSFFFCLILTPLLIFGKAAKIGTWTGITSIEILGWTLILAYMNPKRIVPRINEGYIFAYTLFHWYLLARTIEEKGFVWILIVVSIISIYPTLLIFKSSIENKRLNYNHKLILYYWFLFTVLFTYVDQVALDIIQPIIALQDINAISTVYVLVTAVQLYFISTMFSLMFVGIPLFHLNKGPEDFNVRWKRAKNDWRKIVRHKLGNYIEYQISKSELICISFISIFLFALDYNYNFRIILIICYTVLIPLFFFYLKLSPEENIEEKESSC